MLEQTLKNKSEACHDVIHDKDTWSFECHALGKTIRRLRRCLKKTHGVFGMKIRLHVLASVIKWDLPYEVLRWRSLFGEHDAVPCLMQFPIIKKEDSVMVRSLKDEGSSRYERHFGLSIASLYHGSIRGNIPVNEVYVVLDVFDNQFVELN
ncbi:uncharacterized protein A4U43_C08F19060 [Asparagus officinalis]|nr:uncharacterized protein A4U43_C08F19060 [Asparagus officinalis]